MQIVIDIDGKVYEHIKMTGSINMLVAQIAATAIYDGTPLPEGHGDLIDRSKIYKAIPAEDDNCTGMGMTYDEMDAYNDGIDAMYNVVLGAKSIIEADREVERNEQ